MIVESGLYFLQDNLMKKKDFYNVKESWMHSVLP